MPIPYMLDEMLSCVAIETARMSYPGSMSRGKNPLVIKGTKKLLETYFKDNFPLSEIWGLHCNGAQNFETWHLARVREISDYIQNYVPNNNCPMCVSAKFLNTFMHQLMKYENTRWLFPYLHLPLDQRVFHELKRFVENGVPHLNYVPEPLANVAESFENSPYALPYEDHIAIQDALNVFIVALNQRHNVPYQLNARIELNWLWV